MCVSKSFDYGLLFFLSFCFSHFAHTMDIFNNKKIQWILRQNIWLFWVHNCLIPRNSWGSPSRLLGNRIGAQEASWSLAKVTLLHQETAPKVPAPPKGRSRLGPNSWSSVCPPDGRAVDSGVRKPGTGWAFKGPGPGCSCFRRAVIGEALDLDISCPSRIWFQEESSKLGTVEASILKGM